MILRGIVLVLCLATAGWSASWTEQTWTRIDQRPDEAGAVHVPFSPTFRVHVQHVPILHIGTLVSIGGRDYSEVLRIVAVHGDAGCTVEITNGDS